MYRIVCESYKNYIADFLPDNKDDYRYKIMQPFRLILDLSAYMNEKRKKSLDYRKLRKIQNSCARFSHYLLIDFSRNSRTPVLYHSSSGSVLSPFCCEV